MSKLGRLAVFLSLLAVLLAIPPGPAAALETVSVSLTDVPWAVTPDRLSVNAGTVVFDVSNDGWLPHNFLVIDTDLPPDGLPVDPKTSTVDESQVNIVASTAVLQPGPPPAPGESESLTVDLPPGNYVLICNIPQHYQNGSYVGFQVTPSSVGGIAELPDVSGAPLETGASSGGNAGALAAAIAGAAAGIVALGGAAWYARRRWLQ